MTVIPYPETDFTKWFVFSNCAAIGEDHKPRDLSLGEQLKFAAQELNTIDFGEFSPEALHWQEQVTKLVSDATAFAIMLKHGYLNDEGQEAASGCLDECIEVLNGMAPPYVHFGPMPDDNGIGWWPEIAVFHHDVSLGQAVFVTDFTHLPEEFCGYALAKITTAYELLEIKPDGSWKKVWQYDPTSELHEELILETKEA